MRDLGSSARPRAGSRHSPRGRREGNHPDTPALVGHAVGHAAPAMSHNGGESSTSRTGGFTTNGVQTDIVWANAEDGEVHLGNIRFRFAIPLTQMGHDSKSNSSFIQYCIVVQVQGFLEEKWIVKRRMGHFVRLHKLVKRTLENKGKSYKPFVRPLPRRRYFETQSTAHLTVRKKRLKEFLQDVLALATIDRDVCTLACAFLDMDEDAIHHEQNTSSATVLTSQQQPRQQDMPSKKRTQGSSVQAQQHQLQHQQDEGAGSSRALDHTEEGEETIYELDSEVGATGGKARGDETVVRAHHVTGSVSSEFDRIDKRSRFNRLKSLMRKPIKRVLTLRQNWMRSKSDMTTESSRDTTHTESAWVMHARDDTEKHNGAEAEDLFYEEVTRGSGTVDGTPMMIIKAGYLTKRGGFSGGRKTWKRRYFRLLPTCLSYYSASTMALLGVTRVGDASGIVTCMEPEQAKYERVPANKFGFVVCTEDRELLLYADSAGDREDWMQAISSVIGRHPSSSDAQSSSAWKEDSWYDEDEPVSSPFLLSSSQSTNISSLQRRRKSRGRRGRTTTQESHNLQESAIAEGEEEDDKDEDIEEQQQGRDAKKMLLDKAFDMELPGQFGNVQVLNAGSKQTKLDWTKKDNIDEVGCGSESGRKVNKGQESIADVKVVDFEANCDEEKEHSIVNSNDAKLQRTSSSRRKLSRMRSRRASTNDSIRFDPFDASRAKGKFQKEDNSFDAPDLQRKDPWEVDWNQLELREKVGEGASGQVFRGSLWGSEVAVKKMHCEDITPNLLRALRKEVTILSQLRHPCVVLYIGACTQPPNVGMVTEWCSRGSLFDILHSSSLLLNTRRRLDLALQVAKGMSYLHGRPKQIIHRDLKSMNVLITQAWQAKVADFGLTIVRRKSDLYEDEGGHFGIQGTPQWMAPEVMEGNRYNGKVDVYSFGIVLTEIITRKMPFADRYKKFDFVDAVLEGETPTIPVWASDATRWDDFTKDDDEEDISGEFEPSDDGGSSHDDGFIAPLPPRRSSRFRRRSMLFTSCRDDTSKALAKGDQDEDENESVIDISDEDVDDGADEDDEGDEDMYEDDEGNESERSTSRKSSPRYANKDRKERTSSTSSQGRIASSSSISKVNGRTAKGRRSSFMRKLIPGHDAYLARRAQRARSDRLHPGHVGEADRELRRPANIQRLTLECLSRDPRARPSFQDIVVRLSKLMDNSADDLLEFFDLPRVHEMLEMGSLFDVSLAAREVSKIAHHVQSKSPFSVVMDDHDSDDVEEFSSLSSMSNSAKFILMNWVCPLVVRLVDRLTRETDFILTCGGERVQVHIPERIFAELAVAIYHLLQLSNADDGVTMQSANVIVDQGALPVLTRLFLFADAAQDSERVEVKPSAYDQEAEIQHIVKNRIPDFASLFQAGLILSYLGVATQGSRVAEAVERVILEQLHAVDEASHLASRARSRCQSAGINLHTDTTGFVDCVRFDPMRSSAIDTVNIREQMEDLRQENHQMRQELEALRRQMKAVRSGSRREL